MRINSSVRKAPSVAHVYVGVGPAVTVRRRHRGLRNHNTDDFFEDALEVAALAGAENSENILPAYPAWVSAMRLFPHFFNNPYRLEKQNGLLTLQTGAKARHTERSAGRAEGDDVHRLQFRPVKRRNIAVMLDLRQPFGGNKDRERRHLGSPNRTDAVEQSGQRETPGAIKQATEGQLFFTHPGIPPYP